MRKYSPKTGQGPGKVFLGVSLVWIGVFLIVGISMFGNRCELRINNPSFIEEKKQEERQAASEERQQQRADYQEQREKTLASLEENFASELQAELEANQVEKRSALPCYDPKPPQGYVVEQYEFPISGDPKYGAIVFLFNGSDLVRQFYLPAGTTYNVKGTFGGHIFSAMVILGKNYRKSVLDPCNGTGFFTEDIAYGGINSYAVRPYPFEADMHDEMKIRRSFLRRKISQKTFFEKLDEFY